MKHTLMAGACVIALCGAAHADVAPPLPAYDVLNYCHTHPSPYESENSCVRFEYLMRKQAADDWPATTPAAKTECIAAGNRFQSYQTLDQCLQAHEHDSEVMGK